MDSSAADDDSLTPPISILRRRNSTGTPTKPHHLFSTSSSAATSTTTTTDTSSSSSFSVDFELVSIKPTSYTSLRDILPPPATTVHSPKPPCFAADSRYEISIRNRLVKQAAWAYLQPMSSSTSTQHHHGPTVVFHRLWTHFSGALLRLITAAFDCLQLR
ncbi:hypothetical protein OSB04_009433 [Centaurea solstitialis]|uniref:Uncharacterized protein n=1 Tax=Centaurea solstitialis TaxID=347529 RepID=A0AA38T5M8_9ASTR|nr:hypothetical protein OSB04_009433 [Centaurea solstitialis]